MNAPAILATGVPGGASLLLQSIARSLMLLAVVLGAIWFMRLSSAATRHLWLAAGAVALLAMPLVSLITPAWSVPLIGNPFAAAAPGPADEPAADGGRALAAKPPERRGFGEAADERSIGPGLFDWILLLWLAGAVTLVSILIGARLYGRRMLARSKTIDDRQVLEAILRISRRLGLRRAVVGVENERATVPMVFGALRPRVVLPPGAADWPADRMEAVLLHELAHVRRHDVLVQTLAQIACCLFWVNPLAWVLERRLFVERERACDDVALCHGLKPADFAGHLMEMLELTTGKRGALWVTTTMAEGSDFKDRILSVLDPGARRNTPRRGQAAAAAVLALLLLLPLATFSPWAAAAEPGAGGAVAVGERDEERVSERGAASEAALLAALDDRDPDVRLEAVYALGRGGRESAVAPLARVVRDDEEARVRARAAEMLGRLGSPAALPILIDALANDPEPLARLPVANAVGRIGGPLALDALARALSEDPDPRIRQRAAYWLGRNGD